MQYKIKIFCVGRRHPNWLDEALALYEKRLKSYCIYEWVILKTDKELIGKMDKLQYICFDPYGKSYSSEIFSALLESKVSWNFVIGGADGLPEVVRKGAMELISLSNFTFPHELVRLLITEQIYRALEISKGSAYHK